jgi:hypothetical protein
MEPTTENRSSQQDENANAILNRRKLGKYKIRFAFFDDSDDRCAMRLDKTRPHDLVLLDKSKNCIWCCQLCSDRALVERHTREGFKTKYKCSICDVALCKVPRVDGSSCFEQFHQRSELFNPCTEHNYNIYVRPHCPTVKSSAELLPHEFNDHRFRLIDGFEGDILGLIHETIIKRKQQSSFQAISSTDGSLMQLKFNNEFHKLLSNKRLKNQEKILLNQKFQTDVLSKVQEKMNDVKINFNLVMATAIYTKHGQMKLQQPPHMDYNNEVIYLSPDNGRMGRNQQLRKHDTIPWTGHMPITENGRFLFLWNGPGTAIPFLIPYKKMLLIRGDVVHAGGLPKEYDHCGKEYDAIHLYLPNHEDDADQKRVCYHDHSGKPLSDSHFF